MALAAVEALAAEGKEGVLVYGVDFTDDARAAITEGTMTGSMSYSSQRYTKAALQMAVMLNEGETFESSVYLPLTLVNVDNVADLEEALRAAQEQVFGCFSPEELATMDRLQRKMLRNLASLTGNTHKEVPQS